MVSFPCVPRLAINTYPFHMSTFRPPSSRTAYRDSWFGISTHIHHRCASGVSFPIIYHSGSAKVVLVTQWVMMWRGCDHQNSTCWLGTVFISNGSNRSLTSDSGTRNPRTYPLIANAHLLTPPSKSDIYLFISSTKYIIPYCCVCSTQFALNLFQQSPLRNSWNSCIGKFPSVREDLKYNLLVSPRKYLTVACLLKQTLFCRYQWNRVRCRGEWRAPSNIWPFHSSSIWPYSADINGTGCNPEVCDAFYLIFDCSIPPQSDLILQI